jgi:hypothetical protein
MRLSVRLLILALVHLASAVLAMGGGGGCGGGGISVIDPPISGPFADPPAIVNTPGVPIRLEAKVSRADVNGAWANLMTVRYSGKRTQSLPTTPINPNAKRINPAQILSISGGDPGYAALYTGIPAWKDTVLVPKRGTVRMLVPVMGWPGHAMFHCHILEHEDIGMMAEWHIMGDMPMPM